jgi:hypothetical protein
MYAHPAKEAVHGPGLPFTGFLFLFFSVFPCQSNFIHFQIYFLAATYSSSLGGAPLSSTNALWRHLVEKHGFNQHFHPL